MKRVLLWSIAVSISGFAVADMSNWSDKTICRLAKENGGAEYVTEAKARELPCANNQDGAEVVPKKLHAVAGIDIENDPTIPFFKPPLAPSPTDSLYWFGRLWQMADFNNDGYSDVIYIGTMNPENVKVIGEDTSGLCGGGACEGQMPSPSLFLGDSEGGLTYSPELIIDNRKKPGMSLGRQILAADFNGDDRLDFYVADNAVGTHNGARDSYYLSQDNGTWLESSDTNLSHKNFRAFNHGAATGDIDNDGDMDVVYTELEVTKQKTAFWCLLNDGTGYLKKRRCGGSFAFGLELADMDGDGDLDALVGAHETEGNKWGFTGIVWNNGRGQFNSKKALPRHAKKWSTIPEVSASDLDNDGDLDIVYSRAGVLYVGTAIQVIENLGNKKFKDRGVIPLVEAPDSYKPVHEGNEWNDYIEAVMFRDFNNDGAIDIYLASGSQKTNGTIVINDGKFGFKVFKPAEASRTFLSGRNVDKVSYSEQYQAELLKQKETSSSKLFAKALSKLNDVVFEGEQPFKAFDNPVPLSQSGAIIVGAELKGHDSHGMKLAARLHLVYAGEDISIGTCFEYYPQFKFMAVRASFNSSDWGGVGANQGFARGGCGRYSGYVGHWELKGNEKPLSDLGIKAVLKDLDGVSYKLLEKMDSIYSEDLSSMISTRNN